MNIDDPFRIMMIYLPITITQKITTIQYKYKKKLQLDATVYNLTPSENHKKQKKNTTTATIEKKKN